MFPKRETRLTLDQVSGYWASELSPADPDQRKVWQEEIWNEVRGAWLTGSIRPSPFAWRPVDFLRYLHGYHADEIGFWTLGIARPPAEDEAGELVRRMAVLVPSGDPDTWDEENCAGALQEIAWHWDLLGSELARAPTRAFLEADPILRDIQIEHRAFITWVNSRGYYQPRFWRPAESRSARRGRPPKIAWSVVHAEFLRLMQLRGDFDRSKADWNVQARLEGKLHLFCQMKFGNEISTASLRAKLKIWLPEWRHGTAR